MPYSTLHAMMCCHTNKSNLVLLPFLFSVLCPYIQLFFSVVYTWMLRYVLAILFLWDVGIQVFSRSFYYIIIIIVIIIIIIPREDRDARNCLTNDEKKKKKERKREKHLNWAPRLPLCHFCFFQLRIYAPANIPFLHYYVQEKQKQIEKEKEKCKDKEKRKEKKRKKTTVCHYNEK